MFDDEEKELRASHKNKTSRCLRGFAFVLFLFCLFLLFR
jgi:hypothetical protein